jgi:hypothetical protein
MKTKQKPELSDYQISPKGELIYKNFGLALKGVYKSSSLQGYSVVTSLIFTWYD